MVEGYRLFAFMDQAVVQYVERFQKGPVFADAVHFIFNKTAFIFGAVLSPDIQSNFHNFLMLS